MDLEEAQQKLDKGSPMLMRLINNVTQEVIEHAAYSAEQVSGKCFICGELGVNYIRAMSGGISIAVIFFCDKDYQSLAWGSWSVQVSDPLPQVTSLRVMVGGKETARIPVN